MVSVQERLQMKRVPLENWTISEQLHLASAVAFSGDQNWMTVSRALKMMCGANRPQDWFSQKSCAAQYEKLLENVETPKRKKRNEKDTSQTTVETPIELILRKLTQERITELKKLIQEEREEYIKTQDEILEIQNDAFDENQLREMWTQIEAEEKQKEKEKQKYAQWLKDREERKKEAERAWRPNTNVLQQSPSALHSPTKSHHLSPKVKIEEMEVDDPNSRHGTSPLLTSLLKSPSAAPNPTSSILHNISSTQTRVAAPTITNLLTGSVTNSLAAVGQQNTTKSLALSVASITIPFSSQLQSQPLTGPASSDLAVNIVQQSPSQAAPTLSMLLENKNKDSTQKIPPLARIESHSSSTPSKSNESNESIKVESSAEIKQASSPIKDEDQQLMEVFKGLIPDDINELADILKTNPDLLVNPDLSILENVDDLIDEEPVAQAECSETQINMEIKNFQSPPATPTTVQEIKEEKPSVEEITNVTATVDSSIVKKLAEIKQEENSMHSVDAEAKASTSSLPKDDYSSDLSNDTPLSELIKHETSAKQQEQQQRKELEAEIIINEIDTFESDSNDEKSLENIKREIQGLPGLNDNDSSENSCEIPEQTTVDEIPNENIKIDDAEAKEDETKKSEHENVEPVAESITKEAETVPPTTDNVKEEAQEPEPKVKEETAESEHQIEEKEKIEVIDDDEGPDDAEIHEPPKHTIDLEDTVDDAIGDSVDIFEDDEIDDDEIDDKEIDDKETEEEEEEEKDDTSDKDNEPLNIENKGSVESVEIVEIKDDKSEDDKHESIIIIEETDDANSEENATGPREKNVEPIVEENTTDSKEISVTPTASERKTSTDDELFEDAKDQIDEIKSEENEPNSDAISATQTIMIIDTDDDSPIEVIKEDKTGRTKRDYSRRKQDSNQSIDKRSEETTSAEDVISSISSRLRLKDRERSESPFVEEDSGEPSAKSKRRYSSTPNIDSLPNSPASSDDREYRSWKKSILLVYNGLVTHRFASLFAKPITEDLTPNYKTIILHPMDLQTLKRNIDSGTIRTTLDFKRYVMLMCYNAIFYNVNNEVTCARAKEVLNYALTSIEDFMDTWKKENERPVASTSSSGSSATKIVRGRKSIRLMN